MSGNFVKFLRTSLVITDVIRTQYSPLDIFHNLRLIKSRSEALQLFKI